MNAISGLFLISSFFGLSVCPPKAASREPAEQTVVAKRVAQKRIASSAAPSETADPVLQTRVIRLDNAKASDLARTLERTFSNYGREARLNIVADGRTNALIVTAPEAGLEFAESLIAKLDTKHVKREAAGDDSAARARLTVMIYQVSVPEERLGGVDVEALTARAETPASLKTALEKLGDAKIVCRADHIMDMNGRPEKTKSGAQAPFVRAISMSKSGNQTANIEYENVGLIVTASGEARSRALGSADVDIEFSGVSASGISVGNDVMAPVIRSFTQHFGGGFRYGEPVLLLQFDTQVEGDAMMYVTRIEFDVATLP
jgi:Bacterial type II/III secretion system short domain